MGKVSENGMFEIDQHIYDLPLRRPPVNGHELFSLTREQPGSVSHSLGV
jgi:hypothetical protein